LATVSKAARAVIAGCGVQVGGGVRTLERARVLLDDGAALVVIGCWLAWAGIGAAGDQPARGSSHGGARV